MTSIIGSLNCLYVCMGECFIDSSEPYFFSAFPPVLHFCNERLLFKDSSHVTCQDYHAILICSWRVIS